MRTIITILLFCITACDHLRAQQFGGKDDSASNHLGNTGNDQPVAASTDDLYTDGLILYGQGYYARAQGLFSKAFLQAHTADAAGYIYSCMAAQGNDLAAAGFRKKHAQYLSSIPRYQKGLENIYVTIGPRISSDPQKAGNMYYGDIGATYRIASGVRLWQTFNYLQQDNNLGNFTQYESFSYLHCYLGEGWSVVPSVHYTHVAYLSQSQKVDSINEETKDGKDSWQTHLQATTHYSAPGTSDFIFFATSLRKQKGGLIFEAEPAIHYIRNSYNTAYQYETVGVIDSFYKNKLEGTKNYQGSGSGTLGDTAITSNVYQFGVGVTYRLPIRHEPVMVRLMTYYLQGENGVSSTAFSFYALLQLKSKYWIHLVWDSKGNLPCAFNYEGIYYNFNNKVNSKTGISLQLYPLKKFSPTITYQYEKDTRWQDNAGLTYNSVYLTLKYRL